MNFLLQLNQAYALNNMVVEYVICDSGSTEVDRLTVYPSAIPTTATVIYTTSDPSATQYYPIVKGHHPLDGWQEITGVKRPLVATDLTPCECGDKYRIIIKTIGAAQADQTFVLPADAISFSATSLDYDPDTGSAYVASEQLGDIVNTGGIDPLKLWTLRQFGIPRRPQNNTFLPLGAGISFESPNGAMTICYEIPC